MAVGIGFPVHPEVAAGSGVGEGAESLRRPACFVIVHRHLPAAHGHPQAAVIQHMARPAMGAKGNTPSGKGLVEVASLPFFRRRVRVV